jgi:hypothetical protein
VSQVGGRVPRARALAWQEHWFTLASLDTGSLSDAVAAKDVRALPCPLRQWRGHQPPQAGDTHQVWGKTPEGPFILSEALPAIPATLVHCILRAEYMDMAKLLNDNM